MKAARLANICAGDVKVELALRLLSGESLGALSDETGRPQQQLLTWRERFLAGGASRLGDRASNGGEGREEEADGELSELAQLEVQNRLLERSLSLFSRSSSGSLSPNPNCSAAYAHTLEEPGVEILEVPEWETYICVREGKGRRQATGMPPYVSLDPRIDPAAGLERIREQGINSISLITDPMWCPRLEALEEAFDVCRFVKENYLVDRAATPPRFSKRHRNRINSARRGVEARVVDLKDHLDRWYALYLQNVANRGIPQAHDPVAFERLAAMDELITVAALRGENIEAMTLWIEHEDVLYFHDSASSSEGFEVNGSYVAFAHVIEAMTEYDYVYLGGSAGFPDDPTEGLARFKRGFSNCSLPAYLCSSKLS